LAPIHLANAARLQQATTKVTPTASGRTKGESLEKRTHQVEENIYLLTKTTIMVAFISYGENPVRHQRHLSHDSVFF
jgi:hypothetical protein